MGRLKTTLLLYTFISSTQGAVNWLSSTNGHNETVKENTTTGTTIVTLNATSANSDASLTYVIIEQDQPEKFGIQSTNQLYVEAELDYEVMKSHRLQLGALDGTTNEQADVIIFIEVEDVNDVKPEFTSEQSVTLPTDTAVGSVIYVAQADDADTVGSLVYSIKSGNEDDDFVIDATTGDISLNKSFDITIKAEYDLLLEVTDGVFTVEKSVTFYLNDVIWRNPLNNQRTSLPEDTARDTDILTLNASNALLYTVTQNQGGAEFKVGTNNLYLAQSLDYETYRNYTITLTALASGRSSSIVYIVEVTDVNDNPLEFSPDTATLDISTDTETGTVVFTAQPQDPDTVGPPTFSITGGNSNNDFSINSTTGELIVENTLDPSVTATYTITIEATDGNFTDTLTLTVTVNAIVWMEPVTDTTDNVPENLATFVKNLTAATATVYVIQSVTPNTDKFSIYGNQLVLTSALDYEDTKSYTLVLQAIDGNGKSATVTYMVNVTDENDMAPEFQSAESVIIPENIEVGASIYLAEATDQDSDSTIVYSITGGNTDNSFSINSSTGVLSLNKELSPSSEAELTYSLIIQAYDSVQQEFLSLSVIIKSAPVLVLPNGGVNITEDDTRVGILDILNLTSIDLDNDPNPDYTIVDQSHPGTFEIVGNKLVATGPFDYEDIGEYNVTLQVTDTSKFTRSNQATLDLHILNENDEKPIFTSNTTLDIADDTGSSIIIYQTKADDPDGLGPLTYEIIDGDPNNVFTMAVNGSITITNTLNASAQLTYNLTIQANDTVNVETFSLIVNLITEPQIDSPNPNITLDEGTYLSHHVWNLSSTDIDNDPNPTYAILSQSLDGTFNLGDDNTQLITSATFDYESETLYTVTLSVTDSSLLQRSSTANVTVYINDINDEPPVFISPIDLELREDTAVGINIYNASTTDRDSTSEVATYSISGGNTNDVFDIDSDSGNLTLKAKLSDYSTLQYNLTILANDTVNDATLTLNVSVVTAPVFVFPDYNITISENRNTTEDPIVWVFSSTDRDGDTNPIYGIASQSDIGTFEVSLDGTQLITTTTFDYEHQTYYTVIINVTDSSTFKMSTEATLVVYITDENDNPPVFQLNTSFEISEFTAVGGVIYTATTDDVDTVGNVTYSITGGNDDDHFTIGLYSGKLSLRMELNPQSVSDLQFLLLIEANDTLNTASLNLTVGVRTVPYINITNQTIDENTDTGGGFSIWLVDWNDLDGDTNPTFDILSESVDGTFQIVNSTLVTNASFDYENITEYTASISVTDVFNLTSNGTITVFVNDLNDVTPAFKCNATLDLWEKRSTGEAVYIVLTEDPDTIGTTEVTLKGHMEGKFNLADGNLTLIDGLDFKTQPSYTLQFSANDSVNVATFNLTINVKTAPVLNFTDTIVVVPEDKPISSVLLSLNATDPDGDPNPQFTIIEQSVNGTFDIVGDQLVLKAPLDYEDVKNHTIYVRVTDSSLGLTSNDILTVYVSDVNDNPPSFTSKSQLELREDTQVGSVIYTAEAEDVDNVGGFSFSITGGNSDNFYIDSSSGNITLNNTIDATVRLGFSMDLMVNDSINTNNLTLTIDVKTAPMLLLPDNVTIVENTDTSMNYSVLTLNFTDLDGDVLPTFELLNQSSANTFRISDNSFLVTNAEFDFESENVYNVKIRVTDSSNFNMTSETMFNVYVIDANDVTPVFTSPNTLEIPETQEKDSVIYTAYVNDPDTVGKPAYEIIGGNDDEDFLIDPDSGILTLANTLHPVSALNYVLELQVNDSVNTETLNIDVKVVTIPHIDGGVVEIVEGDYTTKPWTIELNSTDQDGDPNPIFTILSQTLNDTFDIVNNTILVTNAVFDFEGLQAYNIVIQVTDNSTFSLSSSATLTASVLDANDLPPVFTSKTEIFVREDTNTGTPVYTAETYDNDTSGTLTYTIIAGNVGNDLSIDRTSGKLTHVNSFRPGSVPVYNLQIQANDSVNQAVLNLTVNVVTAPTLLFPAKRITIVENVNKSSDSLVWICNSQDIDGDENPEYVIVSQSVNGTFLLNDDNSRLITTATFDYENRTSYAIVLSVTDSSPLKLSSSATLTVYIENLNDEPPVFISDGNVKILDTTTTGSVVYTAVTEDADPEGNVTYTIVDGNYDGDFTIDSTSGNITLVNGLNLTATPNYTLIIQANDTVNIVNFTLVIEVKEDIDECASNPCENNATCNDGIGEYICVCISGYNGTNCKKDIDECASNPCENGASCTDGIHIYNCTCVDGFRGVNCEEDIDECASSPCQNGATCNNLINEYNCTCVPGYEGFNCENETDECVSNSCQNNATCQDLVNEYKCVCVDGFEGVNCENETNECDTVVCRNGAVCNDFINGFECVCNRGYIGTFCEDECPEGTYGPKCVQPCPCVPQATVSCDHVNGTCTCNEFYEGDRCNNDIDECTRNDTCPYVNEGCDNIDGGYICDCIIGYERNASGVCIPVTSVTTTPAVPAGQTSMFFQLTLAYNFPASVNLAVTATYNKYKNEIIIQLRKVYGYRNLIIIILNIRRGSLSIDAYIGAVNETVIQVVSRVNADLASGNTQLELFNQYAPVQSMALNNKSIRVGRPYSDASACQIYETSSSKCTGDFVCSVRDGIPGCELKDIDDNLPLILGLGIGIPAFFVGLAIVVLCIAYYINKNKLLKKRYRREDDESSKFHKMAVRANTGPPTWSFVGSPEYAENTHYGDYSSRDDSQQHGYPDDVIGYYDTRVDRDSDSTWVYLFTQLRPGESALDELNYF